MAYCMTDNPEQKVIYVSHNLSMKYFFEDFNCNFFKKIHTQSIVFF